jgi:hypothetical protein
MHTKELPVFESPASAAIALMTWESMLSNTPVTLPLGEAVTTQA